MKWLLALAVVGVAAFAAAPAVAAIEVSITSPASSAHVGDVGVVVPVQITASATLGVYGVQLNVDGQPYPNAATWDSTQTSLYRYQIAWNTAGVGVGTHSLTVTAMDWSVAFPGGVTQTSAAGYGGRWSGVSDDFVVGAGAVLACARGDAGYRLGDQCGESGDGAVGG